MKRKTKTSSQAEKAKTAAVASAAKRSKTTESKSKTSAIAEQVSHNRQTNQLSENRSAGRDATRGRRVSPYGIANRDRKFGPLATQRYLSKYRRWERGRYRRPNGTSRSSRLIASNRCRREYIENLKLRFVSDRAPTGRWTVTVQRRKICRSTDSVCDNNRCEPEPNENEPPPVPPPNHTRSFWAGGWGSNLDVVVYQIEPGSPYQCNEPGNPNEWKAGLWMPLVVDVEFELPNWRWIYKLIYRKVGVPATGGSLGVLYEESVGGAWYDHTGGFNPPNHTGRKLEQPFYTWEAGPWNRSGECVITDLTRSQSFRPQGGWYNTYDSEGNLIIREFGAGQPFRLLASFDPENPEDFNDYRGSSTSNPPDPVCNLPFAGAMTCNHTNYVYSCNCPDQTMTHDAHVTGYPSTLEDRSWTGSRAHSAAIGHCYHIYATGRALGDPGLIVAPPKDSPAEIPAVGFRNRLGRRLERMRTESTHRDYRDRRSFYLNRTQAERDRLEEDLAHTRRRNEQKTAYFDNLPPSTPPPKPPEWDGDDYSWTMHVAEVGRDY